MVKRGVTPGMGFHLEECRSEKECLSIWRTIGFNLSAIRGSEPRGPWIRACRPAVHRSDSHVPVCFTMLEVTALSPAMRSGSMNQNF